VAKKLVRRTAARKDHSRSKRSKSPSTSKQSKSSVVVRPLTNSKRPEPKKVRRPSSVRKVVPAKKAPSKPSLIPNRARLSKSKLKKPKSSGWRAHPVSIVIPKPKPKSKVKKRIVLKPVQGWRAHPAIVLTRKSAPKPSRKPVPKPRKPSLPKPRKPSPKPRKRPSRKRRDAARRGWATRRIHLARKGLVGHLHGRNASDHRTLQDLLDTKAPEWRLFESYFKRQRAYVADDGEVMFDIEDMYDEWFSPDTE
jgi:hypothetical protein